MLRFWKVWSHLSRSTRHQVTCLRWLRPSVRVWNGRCRSFQNSSVSSHEGPQWFLILFMKREQCYLGRGPIVYPTHSGRKSTRRLWGCWRPVWYTHPRALGPLQWCLFLKKDGGVRLCVDYRRLNQVAKFDAYPMPRIEDVLDKIGPATVITALDLVLVLANTSGPWIQRGGSIHNTLWVVWIWSNALWTTQRSGNIPTPHELHSPGLWEICRCILGWRDHFQ